MDQSSPDFFRGMREESLSINTFSDFGYLDPSRSGDIRDQTRKFSEIAQNFACFWPPISLGEDPEVMDLRYKVHLNCDHVAKFHGDRPRELAGSPAKRNICSKT